VKLEVFLDKVRAERQRNADLPGSEWDARNTPGDWVAIAGHYISAEVRRNGVVPETEEFQDKLIKAVAVIAAALENIDLMRERGELQ
jgi:hypothetical protein